METEQATQAPHLFDNAFQIEDLQVFDKYTWQEMLDEESFGLTTKDLAMSLQGIEANLRQKVIQNLPSDKTKTFLETLGQPASNEVVATARQRILNNLFWELTYWKTPELYDELTEGEKLHPGIFKKLKPDLENGVVLDAGAGSGRASLECLAHGAKQVYAVEPSSGLLQILKHKLTERVRDGQVIPLQGRFNSLPVGDNSIDMTLSCSAFTAEPAQGGEPGLQELLRVTKPGGKIVIIWPRQQDLKWLTKNGFQHVTMPIAHEMKIYFRSLQSAIQCAKRFYQKNRAVLEYLLTHKKPEIPFSVLGVNPPRDYCWLQKS